MDLYSLFRGEVTFEMSFNDNTFRVTYNPNAFTAEVHAAFDDITRRFEAFGQRNKALLGKRDKLAAMDTSEKPLAERSDAYRKLHAEVVAENDAITETWSKLETDNRVVNLTMVCRLLVRWEIAEPGGDDGAADAERQLPIDIGALRAHMPSRFINDVAAAMIANYQFGPQLAVIARAKEEKGISVKNS